MADVPDELELTAAQARVLGCLMEKQATTPESYPLTLKALTTACNQSSSRFPVVDYEAQLVETTALALKGKGLVRVVHPASGERATRYRHVADEALGLDPSTAALLAVLLLRGPQTVAELRTRTERLHPFASAAEVQAALDALAQHPRRLVTRLERQVGQKEERWLQLLEGDAERRAATVPAAVSGGARAARTEPGRIEQLERRVELLERQLGELATQLGAQLDVEPGAVEPDDPA